MKIKKFLTILLTIAMVVSLLPATAFAANNTATTMRLAKAQGTVAVTNATGKKVTQTANMKLYNGYKMKTGAKSYAWISLDDTKVAKLDANSSVEVQKNGKNLTLYLSSGNMFFNVKDPLKSGETFSIKTSTMTTGIRGTSGCVRVISDRVTEVHLLTGQVQIYTEHPGLGVHKTAILQAGQKATSLIDWEAMAVSGEMAEIVIEQLQNHEICGICSEEIANDPELLERIEREAPHLLPERAAAEAGERIATDEAEAEAKQEEIDKAIAEQVFPEDVDPYFEEEAGGGGGGSSAAVEATNVIEVRNWQEFADALVTFSEATENTEIRLMNDILPDADVTTMPSVENDTGSGAKLTINLQDYALQLPDPMENYSGLVITNNEGYIMMAGEPSAVIYNYDDLTLDNGTIVLSGIEGEAGVVNYGTFTMQSGGIRVGSLAMNNSGEYEFTREGNLEDYSGTAIINNGTVDIQGGILEVGGPCIDESNMAEGTALSDGTECTTTISDGTFVSGNASVLMSAGNAAISGGTFTGTVTNDGTSIMEISDGTFGSVRNGADATLRISGGTINSSGIGVQNYGNLEMSAGVINTPGADESFTAEVVQAISNQGTASITDDAIINVQTPSGVGITNMGDSSSLTFGGTINVGGNSAVGIETSAPMEMTGGSISAEGEYATGIRLLWRTLTLSGGSIHAVDTAVAVEDNSEDEYALERPVKTAVTWENASNLGDTTAADHLITPSPYYGTTSGTDGKYSFVDRYNDTNMDGFMLYEAIRKFNGGTENVTFTMTADIDLTNSIYANLPAIEDNGYTFTLAVGEYTLTLANTLNVAGEMKIIGANADSVSGIVKTDAASVLINNTGTLKIQNLAGLQNNKTTACKVVESSGSLTIEKSSKSLSSQVCEINAAAAGSTLIDVTGGTFSICYADMTIAGANSYGIKTASGVTCNMPYYMKITLTDAATGSYGVYAGNKVTSEYLTLAVNAGTGVYLTDGASVLSETDMDVYGTSVGVEATGGSLNLKRVDALYRDIYTYGTATAVKVKNGAALTLTGSGRYLPTFYNRGGIGIDVENGGTVVVDAASFDLRQMNSGTGIKNAGTLTINGGSFGVGNDNGGAQIALDLTGGTANLYGGVIYSDDTAAAIQLADGANINMENTESDAYMLINGTYLNNVVKLVGTATIPADLQIFDSKKYSLVRKVDVPGLTFVDGLNDFTGAADAEVTLTEDIVLTGTLLDKYHQPASNETVCIVGKADTAGVLTIDLNGHTLTVQPMIQNNGKMKVIDSSTEGTGKIVGHVEPNYGGTLYYMIDNRGSFELQSGTIEVNGTDNDTLKRYGVYGQSNANTIEISGGRVIVNNNGYGVGGNYTNVIMSGGELIMNTGAIEGIKNNYDSSFQMTGGTITVNDGIGVYGYSTSAANSSTVLINGGTIHAVGGTGIYNTSNSVLTITAGTITGGDGTEYYAVYNDGAVVAVAEGVIVAEAKTYGLEDTPTEPPTTLAFGFEDEESEEEPADGSEGESADELEGESTDEPEGESTDEPEGEPTDDSEGEPTDEPEGEPTDEPEGEPTDEPEGEPTDDSEGEPTDEPEGEPTDDSEGEPTDDSEGEPTDEPKGESTDEPVDETLEPTE